MALPDLFSRRKRQAEPQGEVFVYDAISSKLRNQIILMISELDSTISYNSTFDIYEDIVVLMRKELGFPRLAAEKSFQGEFEFWFRSEREVDSILDAVEIVVRFGSYCSENTYGVEEKYNDFVEELNARLLEAGVGYQAVSGQIVQMNSQFAHAEMVVPALKLLADPAYSAAEKEFRDAHSEYRAGQYEDCIHDCRNAMESTLKVILSDKGWAFSPNDSVKKLLDVAFAQNLIPAHMRAEFTGLRTILESGVPTVRNKSGGHGAGANPRNIPSYVAAFQLHQTAAALILMIEAAK